LQTLKFWANCWQELPWRSLNSGIVQDFKLSPK
jgi:hypothetical protein